MGAEEREAKPKNLWPSARPRTTSSRREGREELGRPAVTTGAKDGTVLMSPRSAGRKPRRHGARRLGAERKPDEQPDSVAESAFFMIERRFGRRRYWMKDQGRRRFRRLRPPALKIPCAACPLLDGPKR